MYNTLNMWFGYEKYLCEWRGRSAVGACSGSSSEGRGVGPAPEELKDRLGCRESGQGAQPEPQLCFTRDLNIHLGHL